MLEPEFDTTLPSQRLADLFRKYGWAYNENVRAFQKRFDEVEVREYHSVEFAFHQDQPYVWLCFSFDSDMMPVRHDELRIHQLTGRLTFETSGWWGWSIEEIEQNLAEFDETYKKYFRRKKIKQIENEGKTLLNFNQKQK